MKTFWQILACVAALGLAPLLPIWAAATATATPESGFENGNRAYESGKYGEAVAAYEGQVQRGAYSANLFYNLANACFRQNERGRAILNYQRALILNPGHAEAAANLAFVRARVPSMPQEAPDWKQRFAALLPVDDYVLIASAAFWLAMAGGLWGLLSPGRRAAAWGLAAVLLLVSAAGTAAVWQADDGAKNAARAVVLDDQTKALYAPADNSPLVAGLPAGSEVRVQGEHGEWVYAQLLDGKLAWIPAAKVARVVPPAAVMAAAERARVD